MNLILNIFLIVYEVVRTSIPAYAVFDVQRFFVKLNNNLCIHLSIVYAGNEITIK